MSKIRILPLDFAEQAGMYHPQDAVLFTHVQRFCGEHLAERPNFAALRKSWAAVRLNEAGQIGSVVGVAGFRMTPDISLFRAVERGATVKLAQRLNDHFSDAGLRGQEVFLHIAANETPDQRCAGFDSTMGFWDATPANRRIIVAR